MKKLNDEMEQSRLKIKELGSQKKWIDWLSSYNEKLEEYEQYSPEQKKNFLEGIIDKILVGFDKISKEHHLKISFVMPLLDDGIQYHSDNKSGEYDLIDSQTETEFGIKPTPRGKKTTPLRKLFHCHRFCQIARLVNVRTFGNAGVIS